MDGRAELKPASIYTAMPDYAAAHAPGPGKETDEEGILAMVKNDVQAIYKYIKEVHWRVLLKRSTNRVFWSELLAAV